MTITGHLPAAEVSAALHAADLAAFPFTAGATTKSGALLSAFAHGLPTLVTAADPPDPELVDGETVVVAPRVRDVAVLVEALRPAARRRVAASEGGRRRGRPDGGPDLGGDRRTAPRRLRRGADAAGSRCPRPRTSRLCADPRGRPARRARRPRHGPAGGARAAPQAPRAPSCGSSPTPPGDVLLDHDPAVTAVGPAGARPRTRRRARRAGSVAPGPRRHHHPLRRHRRRDRGTSPRSR